MSLLDLLGARLPRPGDRPEYCPNCGQRGGFEDPAGGTRFCDTAGCRVDRYRIDGGAP